ncbi:NtaA/DmoA family FMN-dependent monooxygenase [Modestobacter excelsi]|uniref:NtaA/DmoA family FMN-dependent monooxygenase n=1 Tax=Modestobacter excelsi TaxID=2213161 RepID=UPI00110CC36E|nr:NtaA/DmoA family FMN-dependent monooxygenase [Modestobacter excelsi]
MTTTQRPDLRFFLFTAFTPGGPVGAPWHHPGAVGFDYLNLDHQTRLAQALEVACFDAIFWADFSGVHDIYKSSPDTAIREAVQFPLGDPLILTAALAGATENLGFAFSSNIIQDHPYAFARRVATLDHLTKGRVAWNVVTSYQQSAWRNLGFDSLEAHANRYGRAQEYIDVVRKLLTESWEDGAVVRDTERRVYADPSLVHPIAHAGERFRVPGIALTEPSPQRMPVVVQAGTSDDGRDFSARNAEAIFVGSRSPEGAEKLLNDMAGRLEANGRTRADLLAFQYLSMSVASTEDEVKRKNEELDEHLSSEAALAFNSSTMGTDLSQIDLDKPIGDFKTDGLQGSFKMLAEAASDKTWTFRDVVSRIGTMRFIGTPPQVADELEKWRAAGVDGINLSCLDGVQGTYDFIEQAVPVLQERGLMQRNYSSGTLRDKLYRR